MNINIKKFEEKFNKEYDFLYENKDNVCGYNEALVEFDIFLKNNKAFVSEFVKYRGDYVASDREAVAFMFALTSF